MVGSFPWRGNASPSLLLAAVAIAFHAAPCNAAVKRSVSGEKQFLLVKQHRANKREEEQRGSFMAQSSEQQPKFTMPSTTKPLPPPVPNPLAWNDLRQGGLGILPTPTPVPPPPAPDPPIPPVPVPSMENVGMDKLWDMTMPQGELVTTNHTYDYLGRVVDESRLKEEALKKEALKKKEVKKEEKSAIDKLAEKYAMR
mmetsp:Transcript_14395/g.23566  ORF Transcript_14395/g.23566 Transcript_14395/m.23566 type:complete len:198 (+) Transcript_14395:85-678(+)|eukprot:CAMPEP_0169119812 /NCGR_PEP_ID=MMETSP1015-20121227/31765_1 /TAXON_ID=342587 /ORGANISM="Karlodinium micrum, Strain CCMP2283" /LENGTH=197 /DNA_ID=CAMNT_0009182735 /DNA_START=81 /DNA_END=677 /DNA_ORIENTATION=-